MAVLDALAGEERCSDDGRRLGAVACAERIFSLAQEEHRIVEAAAISSRQLGLETAEAIFVSARHQTRCVLAFCGGNVSRRLQDEQHCREHSQREGRPVVGVAAAYVDVPILMTAVGSLRLLTRTCYEHLLGNQFEYHVCRGLLWEVNDWI